MTPLKQLLLFIGVLLWLNAPAQKTFPSIFEVSADTAIIDTLPTASWQMLEDNDGKLTFEQVSQSALADNFHYDITKKINFHISTYWFRFNLKNSSGRPLKIGFYDNYKARSDWYFVEQPGKITHILSGSQVPWSLNKNLRLSNYFLPESFVPLTLEPGQTIMFYNRAHYDYFHYDASNPRQFFITYGSKDKVILQNYIVNEERYFGSVHDAFFFGLMVLAAVFNFLFFLIIRERTYLYFALYVFFLGLGRFNIYGELYHIFLREHSRFYDYFVDFVWGFAPLFLGYFVRSLLNTRKHYPRLDKFILYVTWVSVFALWSSKYIEYWLRGTENWQIPGGFSFFVTVFFYLSLLVTLCLFLTQDVAHYRRFLIAILPSFALWLVGFCLFTIQLNIPVGPGFFSWIREYWHVVETICLSWLVICFSWLLFHRFVELRQQVVQKELEKEMERSQLMSQQKFELETQVAERTSELKRSLEDLKSTQAQLIQQGKMASLGELTAGIAHEIQNPLNFVNNFSEVNNELISELIDEVDKGNTDEVKSIAADIKENSEKISSHGKRAESIVKGMLQHSATSSGHKEMTDINALVDEYLRLAYHGFCAKNKSFNAQIKTDFDLSVEKINVVPQDVGRVVLNLLNNAFYAVNEKTKLRANDYEPRVSVITKKIGDKIEIKVGDNGNGIPQNIVEKVFQPFFTTKPTGQGTGLGLSLAYDIVKAHGGEIKVETKEKEGSTFIIQLHIQA